MRPWLLPNKYMSPELVNESIILMRNCVVRRILNTIHDAKLFAILADETREVGLQHKEQHAICIRCMVDDQLDIHEDFIMLLCILPLNSLYTAYMSSFGVRCHFRTVVVKCTIVPQTIWVTCEVQRNGLRHTGPAMYRYTASPIA